MSEVTPHLAATIADAVTLPAVPEVVVEDAGQSAGNLHWNSRDQSLWWTDYKSGALYRYDSASKEKTIVYNDMPVQAFVPQEDGTLVIFRGRDIAILDHKRKNFVVPLLEKCRVDGDYFNHAVADAEGRILVGTVREGRPNGAGIYRLDHQGRIAKILGGTGCSAGMAWSLKFDALYWTCATTKTICRCRYDQASGQITNRQVFQECLPDEGTPDGLVTDNEETLWSARRDAGAILKVASSRKLIGQITFPVRNIYSLAFGGEDFKTVFVSGRSDEESARIFSVRVSVPGKAEMRSRIDLPE